MITAAPRITAGVTAAPVPSVARKADKDVKLPDIGATLHEHTSDAVRLAAYLQAKEPYHAFARDAAGAFKQAVEAEYSDDISLAFTFTPDGGLARGYHDGDTNGIDFYNDAGQVTRSMHWVGKPRNRDWFSPRASCSTPSAPRAGSCACGTRRRACGWPRSRGSAPTRTCSAGSTRPTCSSSSPTRRTTNAPRCAS
ncbi:hypothetical protein ACFQQB_50075 [Nonomuraea rubra]|uniref:hypothetical protein n=1 Tax=Nonomuraea rubra TaxID=46180 RepID=UPI003611FEE1